MQTMCSPSVDISIAVLSWINAELRGSLDVDEDEVRVVRTMYWTQQAVTVLTAGLSGLCLIVFQTWA